MWPISLSISQLLRTSPTEFSITYETLQPGRLREASMNHFLAWSQTCGPKENKERKSENDITKTQTLELERIKIEADGIKD